MPSLRWDCEAFAPTLFSRGPTFEADGQRYGMLYVTGDDLTKALHRNARGHWPEDARVEGPRVYLRTTDADGVGRIGRVRHELVHGVKLRFVLVACEMPPPEAWGGWKLRRFEKAQEMAEG